MRSIILFFQVEWTFLRVLLSGIKKNENSEYFWCFKKWTTGHSFRVVGIHAHADRWAVLRYWKRAMTIFTRKSKVLRVGDNCNFDSQIGVYCQETVQRDEFGNYVSRVLGRPIDTYYFRDDMPLEASIAVKLLLVIHILVLSSLFFLVSFFHSKKSHLGLILLQWLENHSLCQHMLNKQVSRLYYFGGYENDSCFTGLCFRYTEVELIMVPSANPIRNFYQQTIAHGFVFTAPFQKVEWAKYRDQWAVKDFYSWPMEGFQDLIPYFRKSSSNSAKNVLAFMSRGMWLRQLRGVQSQNNNMDFLYERNCMEVVKSFLIDHPEIKLLILPHPIEKREPEIWSKAMEHYSAFFQGVNVQFPQDVQLGSYAQFDSAEVSVASISSVNIERLFCGYKTIYAPVGASMDFFGGSELDHIVAKTAEDLRNLLERSFQLTETDFFRVYELNEYHFSHYSDFL